MVARAASINGCSFGACPPTCTVAVYKYDSLPFAASCMAYRYSLPVPRPFTALSSSTLHRQKVPSHGPFTARRGYHLHATPKTKPRKKLLYVCSLAYGIRVPLLFAGPLFKSLLHTIKAICVLIATIATTTSEQQRDGSRVLSSAGREARSEENPK